MKAATLLAAALLITGEARADLIATYDATLKNPALRGDKVITTACVAVHSFKAPRMHIKLSCPDPTHDMQAAMDVQTGNGWTAIARDKSYFAITPGMMSQNAVVLDSARKALQQNMGIMKELMAQLPATQAKALEDSMKKQGLGDAGLFAKSTLVKTGAVKNVQGLGCEVWNVTRKGAAVNISVCLVKAGTDARIDALYQSFAPYAQSMRRLGDLFLAGLPEMQEWFVAESLDPGLAGGAQARTLSLTKIEQALVGEEMFAVPAGYTKSAMPQLPKGGFAAPAPLLKKQ